MWATIEIYHFTKRETRTIKKHETSIASAISHVYYVRCDANGKDAEYDHDVVDDDDADDGGPYIRYIITILHPHTIYNM